MTKQLKNQLAVSETTRIVMAEYVSGSIKVRLVRENKNYFSAWEGYVSPKEADRIEREANEHYVFAGRQKTSNTGTVRTTWNVKFTR